MYGGENNDVVDGEDGDDRVEGDNGDDVVIGGLGSDVVVGDAGDDILYGGGIDSFDVYTIRQANPGVFFHEASQSFYQLVTTPLTFTAASTAASGATLAGTGATGHLLSIESSIENEFIYNYLQPFLGGNRVWIAASDNAVEGEWLATEGAAAGYQISQGGTQVNGLYSNWGGGQPNNLGWNTKLCHIME